MNAPDLHWLASSATWAEDLKRCEVGDGDTWTALVQLANSRIDFVQTGKLDRRTQKLFSGRPPAQAIATVRLAVLASSTVDHLLPGLRIGALRRGMWLDIYVCAYGQYRQELLQTDSALHRFKPQVVLFALDARSVAGRLTGAAGNVADCIGHALQDLQALWQQARNAFDCRVLQQTLLPVFASLAGNNEQRLSDSPQNIIRLLNEGLRRAADVASIDLIDAAGQAAMSGLDAWHDQALWYRAKQEIHPAAAPCYGDLVARVLAAARGRSFKCLALDLDNTLWGGVIGDDGIEGIVLGQGSASGEAFVGFQQYAKALSRRGVILAVCSKNDEDKALEPFEKHPEMVLRRSDIACFVCNWQDKPQNLRQIASHLNIGIDAIVFADDNPFERNIVRRELPAVGVPELPPDPGLYAHCIAAGGYFELLQLTTEDEQRTRLYQQNAERIALQSSSTDLPAYLQSLDMRMKWSPFDRAALTRVHQLINKTNQFNLTTRRYQEVEVESLLGDADALTLQLRLLDQFGDNGLIAVVIGRRLADDEHTLLIDSWLMSCRVLGRQVEEATLNVLAGHARTAGFSSLVGEFRPTAKNAMVRDHYARLGFERSGEDEGATRWRLGLEDFTPLETFIRIERAGV